MNCNEVKALNYTQRIIQGDSFFEEYTGKEVDTSDNSEMPVDFSNKTIRAQARPDANSDEVVNFSTSTLDSGSGTVDTFRLQLTSSQTSQMMPGTWVYDVDMVDINNNEMVTTLLKGNFIVRAEVTK